MRLALLVLLLAAPTVAAQAAPFDLATTTTAKTVRPQTVADFPIEVTSRAPGAIRVSFDVDAPPAFQTPVPADVTLTPDRPTAKLSIMVLAPYRNGHVDESGVVTLRAWSPDAGGERTATFSVRAQGMYVPGAGAAVAALALALAPALARRR